MKLSIVLPCYHPPEGWAERIAAVHAQVSARLRIPVQLIIVDDGNGHQLEKERISWLQQMTGGMDLVSYPRNRGKGYALRQGIAIADGDIIIYTDIDFPYTIESLLAVYDLIHDNVCDVAIGVKNQDYYSHVPRMRRIISRNLRAGIGLFLRIPVTDTQCGLKGFRKSVKPVFLGTRIERYLFDLEFVYTLYTRFTDIRVKAVPVQLNPGVIFRKMNYRILVPEAMNFLRLLLRR